MSGTDRQAQTEGPGIRKRQTCTHIHTRSCTRSHIRTRSCTHARAHTHPDTDAHTHRNTRAHTRCTRTPRAPHYPLPPPGRRRARIPLININCSRLAIQLAAPGKDPGSGWDGGGGGEGGSRRPLSRVGPAHPRPRPLLRPARLLRPGTRETGPRHTGLVDKQTERTVGVIIQIA